MSKYWPIALNAKLVNDIELFIKNNPDHELNSVRKFVIAAVLAHFKRLGPKL